MIEHPPNRKYTITGNEIWDILILVETQGGLKDKAFQINKIMEEIVRRHDA